VTEFCFGAVPDEDLDLVPIPFVIPNFFAICTDGQQPFQRFDIVESLLQFDVQFFSFFLGLFARG
jgi:hypothetical protein